jgi:GAF domain-containing protein
MAEDGPCTKWAPNRFSLRRQRSGTKGALLRGEKSILELISRGAPLPEVLDKLCAAIDLQIGNVVSVILRADDPEHDLSTITQKALQFGLHVFWSASIPLRNEDVLGSLLMFCCVSQSPTPFELRLIERVTHLAALAIQRHKDEEDFESLFTNWVNTLRRGAHQRVYLN